MKSTIAVFLALFALSAHAWEVEASVGQTQYQGPPNTIWHQANFPNTFDLKSNSWSVGVTDYLAPQVRWRAAFVNLGNTSSSAQATSDANYNSTNHCTTGPCPLNTYRTEGSIRGFSFTLAPETRISPTMKAFVEAGLFVFQPKFYADVATCANCTPFDRQQYSDGWKVGPQIGFGVEHVPTKTQVVLTAYRVDTPSQNEAAVPNWQGWAINVALRHTFWGM